MPLPSKTSLTLLSRLRTDDHTAWQRLVDIYGPFLLGRLRRRGLSDTDAEDVLQDVFATVARKISDFRRDRPGDSFLRWLQTVTSTRLIDFHRRRKRQIEATGGNTGQNLLGQIPDPFEGEDWAADGDARQVVLTQILQVMKSEFRENTWRCFWLFVVEGKSTDEISLELGMSAGAIRQARSKVRKRLAEEFQELFEPITGSTDVSSS